MTETKNLTYYFLRSFIVIAVCILLLSITVLMLNILVKKSSSDRIFDLSSFLSADNGNNVNYSESNDLTDPKSFEAALVLGCGVYNNAVPSPLLRERLDMAIEIYSEGIVNKLIMSGDHGQVEYNEVAVMKNYAIEKGVPTEDIFMDHAGFSTYESVYRAKEVFGLERVIIISQEYHLYRALYIANAFDLEATGIKADQTRLGGQTARDLREILARCKDVFFCIVKPDPTHLGEPIDITGSGDVTNDYVAGNNNSDSETKD